MKTAWQIYSLLLGLMAGVCAWPNSSLAQEAATNPVTNLPPLLTRINDIRRLSAEQAERGYPVRVRGVVVNYNRQTQYNLVIHDGEACTYIGGTTNRNYKLWPGQLIEVEGLTALGNFAPMVMVSNLHVLGESQIPRPTEISAESLADGTEIGQWVRIQGIVRATDMKNERPVIDLSTAGIRTSIRLENYEGDGSEHLVDAVVSADGVLMPVFNRNRQLLDMRLSVPGMEFLRVEKLAPEDPFGGVPRPIRSLGQFSPNRQARHRVKVQGVVLLQLPGKSIFIRDHTQGLWVKTQQGGRLNPGDLVDVLGFPAEGEYTPVLEDATFLQVGMTRPPEPTALTVEQARTGDRDSDLIRIEAQLLQCVEDSREFILVLQENNFIFKAHLDRSAAGKAFTFPTGSRIQLTGVCLTQMENQRWPQSFRLLLRSSLDAVMIQPPPWWNLKRMLWMLLGVTVVSAGAMVWVVTLRRRVRTQTEIIRQNTQREAILEERTRLAREFHDTLEQELAGIRIQLDALATDLASPEAALHSLDIARSMIRHSESEARRSVHDLRAGPLDSMGLVPALAQIASRAKNGHPTRVQVEVLGCPGALPASVENHLLRIAQEATTNALKHSEAKAIRIELCYEPISVRLCVRDDGSGFDAGNATSLAAGHFGLLGMRERAEKLGGKLVIFSTAGEGTLIEVTVPLDTSSQPAVKSE